MVNSTPYPTCTCGSSTACAVHVPAHLRFANPASPVLPGEEAQKPCMRCGGFTEIHIEADDAWIPCMRCNGTGYEPAPYEVDSVSPEAPSDDSTKHPALCDRCGERNGMARDFGRSWLCDPCYNANAEGRAEDVESEVNNAIYHLRADLALADERGTEATVCTDHLAWVLDELARLRGSVSRPDAQEDMTAQLALQNEREWCACSVEHFYNHEGKSAASVIRARYNIAREL